MNIIINGGSRGIGREVTARLASDKSNRILVTGRNKKALEELSSTFRNVNHLGLDLSDFTRSVDIFTATVNDLFEHIDILVNNAGLLLPRRFPETKESEARMMMDVNFFGPASMISIVIKKMSKGSHILNISSMGGFQGSSKYPGLSYYSASKAALACLTECLATEFTDSGIHVNCLALGSVQTEMLEEAFPGYTAPLKAAEMAEFICDFAMKGHRYFNGKILPVAVNNP